MGGHWACIVIAWTCAHTHVTFAFWLILWSLSCRAKHDLTLLDIQGIFCTTLPWRLTARARYLRVTRPVSRRLSAHLRVSLNLKTGSPSISTAAKFHVGVWSCCMTHAWWELGGEVNRSCWVYCSPVQVEMQASFYWISYVHHQVLVAPWSKTQKKD